MLFLSIASFNSVILRLWQAEESPWRIIVKADSWILPPEILIQWVWAETGGYTADSGPEAYHVLSGTDLILITTLWGR